MKQLKAKENWIQAIKTAIAVTFAVGLSQLLHLDNILSAGIVAILTLQSTKRETFLLAGKRLAGFATSLVIAYLCFSLFGFHIVTYGVFVLVFALVCLFGGMSISIPVCVVLAGYFLLEQSVALPLMLNQVVVFLIGTSAGILLNLFINPKVKPIWESQQAIDSSIRGLLYQVAHMLTGEGKSKEVQKSYEEIQKLLEQAIYRAEQMAENFLLSDYSYYPAYLSFRRNQLALLREFAFYQTGPYIVSEADRILADFVLEIADSFHECNDATQLLARAEEVREALHQLPLPENERQLEARAESFGQFKELVGTLQLKKNFINGLTDTQKGQYWIKCDVPRDKKID